MDKTTLPINTSVRKTGYTDENILFQDPYTVIRVGANSSEFSTPNGKIFLAKVSKENYSSLSTLVLVIRLKNPFFSAIMLAFGIDVVTIWIITLRKKRTISEKRLVLSNIKKTLQIYLTYL